MNYFAIFLLLSSSALSEIPNEAILESVKNQTQYFVWDDVQHIAKAENPRQRLLAVSVEKELPAEFAERAKAELLWILKLYSHSDALGSVRTDMICSISDPEEEPLCQILAIIPKEFDQLDQTYFFGPKHFFSAMKDSIAALDHDDHTHHRHDQVHDENWIKQTSWLKLDLVTHLETIRTFAVSKSGELKRGYSHFHRDRHSGETHFDWHESTRRWESGLENNR